MSFNWAVKDITAGIEVIWSIWEAVSDSAPSLPVQATQFLEDYARIIERLEEWELRAESTHNGRVSEAFRRHEVLKEECIIFIRRHRRLIQDANPQTETVKEGHRTWLRKAKFTKEQVISLYEATEWPFEQKEMARLRDKLRLYLQAAVDPASSLTNLTNVTSHDVRDMRTSNAELLSPTLKLVSPQLDLVSLVSLNLKRVTYPLESSRQENQIDYPMLQQFKQALLPPEPLEAIEGSSGQQFPLIEEAPSAAVDKSGLYEQNPRLSDQTSRSLLSERLSNLSMRQAKVINATASTESNASSSIEPLLERLRLMRGEIVDEIGIPSDEAIVNDKAIVESPTVVTEPRSALREELAEWNQLESRIQYEILHPGHLRGQSRANTYPISTISVATPKPRRARPSISLPSSSDGHGRSRNEHSSQITPKVDRQPSMTRKFSMSSNISRPDRPLPCKLQYPGCKISAVIQSLSRFEDGQVQSVTTFAEDGLTEIRHSVDLEATTPVESSMKPFLDNSHVDTTHKSRVDTTHKFRVRFQGEHNLKITKTENRAQDVSRYHYPPVYTFSNKKDFLDFQSLLLKKEVKQNADFNVIKSLKGETQCRSGSISILFDPINQSRSILYFRDRETADGHKPSFVEWPVSLFEVPQEPESKSNKLSLSSADGKILSVSKALSRRSTSENNPAALEPAANAHSPFSQMHHRSSSGKGIKGLVVEFYDESDCHDFWEEFTKKEVGFENLGVTRVSSAEVSG